MADSIYGALYTPSDGIARAWQLAAALADHAQAAGVAQFYGNTNVTGIDVADGRVVAVCTDRGRIRTEAVVCAAGIWGRLIGQMAGVSLPLVPFCHLYAETAPLPELASETVQYRHPILRHQDRAIYCRQEGQAYLIGSYDHEPLRVEAEDIWSHDQAPEMPSMMPWSAAAFRQGMRSAGEVLPALSRAALTRKVNGPAAVYARRPARARRGTPRQGVLGRGGRVDYPRWRRGQSGRRVDGQWPADYGPAPKPTSPASCRTNARRLTWPSAAHSNTARCTTLFTRPNRWRPRAASVSCHTTSAVGNWEPPFVESAGWERPQWFAANEALIDHCHTRSGWAAHFWSPIIGAEHRAVRERVGIF